MNRSDRKAQLANTLQIIAAVAEALRDLTESSGGVPSGELYAHLMTRGIGIQDYNVIIGTLERAKLITNEGHWLKWVGPDKKES